MIPGAAQLRRLCARRWERERLAELQALAESGEGATVVDGVTAGPMWWARADMRRRVYMALLAEDETATAAARETARVAAFGGGVR